MRYIQWITLALVLPGCSGCKETSPTNDQSGFPAQAPTATAQPPTPGEPGASPSSLQPADQTETMRREAQRALSERMNPVLREAQPREAVIGGKKVFMMPSKPPLSTLIKGVPPEMLHPKPADQVPASPPPADEPTPSKK
jgi:hypothetical protein